MLLTEGAGIYEMLAVVFENIVSPFPYSAFCAQYGFCARKAFFLFTFFAHARFAQLAAGKGVYIGYENGNILRGSSAVIGESELYDGIIVGIDAVMIIKRHPHAYYIPV